MVDGSTKSIRRLSCRGSWLGICKYVLIYYVVYSFLLHQHWQNKILNILAYSFDCRAAVFIRAKYDKQYI